MKLNNLSIRRIIAVNFFLIIGLSVIIPILLDLIEFNYKVIIISILGKSLVLILISMMIIDMIFLLLKKQNYYILSLFNMSLSLLLFLLMVYSFLNGIYELVYVMNYSNTSLPLIYKIVAIWAGEQGSIMTWMLFNSVIINFYRIKNHDQEDLVFVRSVIISLIISTVFLIILYTLNPFKVDSPPIFPTGEGLNPLLISPFMIWHPFFTFFAYAIFLVPFSITIAEVISGDSKLLRTYQQNFYDFSLKFGWLVLTLSIGLGAYWAKIALNWGRYWGWDPVETVSLVPWFFITAFFHTRIFQKKKPILIKINIGLIFSSIIFSTLITRTGNLSPLHSFAGGAELVIWDVAIGIILILFSLYVIYIVLDYLMVEYRNKKLMFDYLSYLFLFGLAFICIFGLFITPFTLILSEYFTINVIYILTDYFIITTLILAVGLAISLIFCSSWEYFKIKWIIIIIVIGILIQSIITIILSFFDIVWAHPVIVIYFIALIASLFKLIKNFEINKGFKYFFRLNSKTLIHLGISFILMGTVINSNFEFMVDFFYISGFIIMIIAIVPSIIISFFPKKVHKIENSN